MSVANFQLDLVNYLITLGHATQASTDIFYGPIPPSPDNLVNIFEYPGQASPISNFDLRSIQVVTRNKSDESARVKAWAIYNAFHPEAIEDSIIFITATRWAIFGCRQPPFFLKEDENKRRSYVFNMGVTTHYDT